jgi:hypothetical protein
MIGVSGGLTMYIGCVSPRRGPRPDWVLARYAINL